MATDPDPRNLDDPVKVRKLMANAVRLGRADMVKLCKVRLYEIAGEPYDTPLERRFWETVAAYEEQLTEKNGRKTRANRLRKMLDTKSVSQVIAYLATSSAPTEGFEQLVMSGNARYTAEHIVAEFPTEFDRKTVDAALDRLQEFEIEVPEALIMHLGERGASED